jgi:hypothetical protein
MIVVGVSVVNVGGLDVGRAWTAVPAMTGLSNNAELAR